MPTSFGKPFFFRTNQLFEGLWGTDEATFKDLTLTSRSLREVDCIDLGVRP